MIKKCFIIISIIAITIGIFQNNYAMEEQKSKATHSKVEESDRPMKQLKISEEEIQQEASEEPEQFRPFDILPFEMTLLIFESELYDIIKSNSIFTPLEGVKVYLDSIAGVCKQFHAIAEDLGRGNGLSGGNKEPKYRILVKALFVPSEIKGKDIDSLNSELMSIVNNVTEYISNIRAKLDQPRLDPNFNEVEFKQKFFLVIDSTIKNAAQYLIAGADPNLILKSKSNPDIEQPMIIAIIRHSELHSLIPLLLLKKIDLKNDAGSTILMCVRHCHGPKLLKMLLDYDKSNIDGLDEYYLSALEVAVICKKIEAVKLLLEYGAKIGNALYHILKNENDEDEKALNEIERDERSVLDVNAAKLLIKYGAELDDDLPFASHPIITRGWLITTKKKEDIKKKLAFIKNVQNY